MGIRLNAFYLITVIIATNTVIFANGQRQKQEQSEKEVAKKCKYEDTIDLKNAEKLSNGSYLYESTIIISPDRVSSYDYEELFDGVRINVTSHLRGCLCDEYRCMKFCCHPTNELIAKQNGTCRSHNFNEELFYNPYLNVTFNNGSTIMVHAINDFIPIQGVPCKLSYPIVPQESNDDTWTLFENGTLLRHFDHHLLSKRDYCMHPYKLQNDEWVLNPRNCLIPVVKSLSTRINNYGMIISVIFIVLTITVYLLLPKLRNLHGKCLISYLFSLALGYSILCVESLSTEPFSKIPCSLMGYTAYLFLIGAFFWLSVISYDLWQNFRFTTVKTISQHKRFRAYCLYAWGCPLILTIVVIIAQNSNLPYALKPGIGDDCWLKTEDWSAMIYFFGINFIIIIVNICMFVFTIIKIIQIQKELQRALNIEEQNRHLRNHKNNVTLFLRLFIIMGITWFFDTISYVVGHDPSYSTNIIFLISDFMNAIQGILIFILFVVKPKVWKMLKSRISTIRDRERGASTTTQSQRITLQNVISNNKLSILLPKN